MKIWKKLFRRSKSNTLPISDQWYTELSEFPLYHWQKCTDGDVIYIRRNPDLNHDLTDQDIQKWNEMYDQYLKRYGLGKLYQKLLRVMKQKALMEIQYVKTREKFKITEIALKEQELRTMLDNRGEGMSIDQSLIHLSRWLGYRLNAKEINVVEYYEILDQYGKANQKNGHSGK